MQFRDMEYFAAIAEERHLGRASERLGLSTPALSKSLRRIETAMQAKLVKRTPKGVELTPEGEALLVHVRRLRLSLGEAVREISELGEGRVGLLRICAHPALVDDLLAPACESLLKSSPRIALSITTETTDVAIARLRQGDFDLALATIPAGEPGDLRQEHLFDDHVVVFASVDHPLAGKGSVSKADIARERWVVTSLSTDSDWAWLHASLDNIGLPPGQVAVRTSSLGLRNHLVATCGFLGVSSRRLLGKIAGPLRLREIPVKDVGWVRRIGVTYRKDSGLRPITRRMIEALKANVAR